jgi:hypothetical protein
MTSVHAMHEAQRVLGIAPALLLMLCLCALLGCGQRLVHPTVLAAPYEQAQLWAVAPFVNESGVPEVDTFRIADAFAQQVQGVAGLNALPVNRVILALRQLDLPAIRSPVDARTLMSVLGADGLIVGTVTAYDPYRPMTLGAAVELYVREDASDESGLDVRALSRAARAAEPITDRDRRGAAAQAAGVFHAANHEVLAELRDYAFGRSAPESAYGRDIYLVSMDMYAQFVSFRLIRDLLQQERLRLSRAVEESRPR